MANTATYKYKVSSLTDSGNGNVTVLLTPEVTYVDNGDGTTLAVQGQQNSLTFLMSESEAKSYWPGQEVTLTLK